jgi:hypothetical protein
MFFFFGSPSCFMQEAQIWLSHILFWKLLQ